MTKCFLEDDFRTLGFEDLDLNEDKFLEEEMSSSSEESEDKIFLDDLFLILEEEERCFLEDCLLNLGSSSEELGLIARRVLERVEEEEVGDSTLSL